MTRGVCGKKKENKVIFWFCLAKLRYFKLNGEYTKIKNVHLELWRVKKKVRLKI